MNIPSKISVCVTRTSSFIQRHFLQTVIILLVIWSYAFFALGQYTVYHKYPELSRVAQTAKMLSSVGNLIQLPSGETPTVVVIQNAASVKKNQPFLFSAKDGDILIIYAKASEAILYRPSTNKLISVGSINRQKTLRTTKTTSTSPTPITSASSIKKYVTGTGTNK